MRKVFISYSHDSEVHRARVLALADRLNREGFDCTIDQYDPHPREPWPRWMERQIEEADFVLVVCTERYLVRATGREAAGVGHGVAFESVLIVLDLFGAAMWNDKFIPVVFRQEDLAYVPKTLRGYTRYQLEDAYPALRAHLAGEAGAVKPRPSGHTEGTTEPREIERALADARRRERDLLLSGADARDVREEILGLRRSHRNRDRLRPDDLLVGRYLLHSRIGKGNFGTIWKAFDERDKRVVAVKILHEHHHDDQTRIERFVRGARKMADLDHPGIVKVLDRGPAEVEPHFFVMEYVEGQDLHQTVIEKRLPPENIYPLIRQVADALQYAHDQGVIHRDIKPANILMGVNDQPKLTDFDLVRAADTTGGTQWGGMFGTVLYSAPEAIGDPEHAGPSADVYSLAMTIAFCLFEKEVPYLRDVAPFLDQLPCAQGVRAALIKGTAWEASGRFQAVKELAEAIEKGLATPIEVEKHDRRRRNHVSPKPPAALLPYLEMQVANLPEADRSGAVLERIERALSLGASDLTTLGVVAWALDYFPGRSARADEREEAVALRDRAFASLRERCPPPQMPGRDDPAWAAIPGGSFWMGSPPGKGFDSERPTHEVAISPFQLGIHAVTEAEYARLAGGSGNTANLPATGVDWYSAYAYAAWLGGRLPTEAEWEYAARGGTEHEYADRHGEKTTLDKVGWYSTNAKSQVQPVGRLEPNPWGLYDMIGNVWEWVADWFGPYSVESQSDPTGPASGERRVVRGGSACFDAGWARAAFRLLWSPDFEFVVPGFRVALPAGSKAIALPGKDDAYTVLSSGFLNQPKAVSTRPSEGATLSAFVRSLPSSSRLTTGVTQAALSVYLEKEVAHLPEADRSGAILERIERALSLGELDLTTLGIVAWAVDYFPGRSARTDERDLGVALRDRAFAPLRERRPPPLMPGRDDPGWAAIPGGSFWMGSPPGKGLDRERPVHQVTISPFRLAVLPVNEAEYARFMSERGKNPELPASGMDWYAAYAYAAWLGGRLPTESEWEYAARGGQEHEYTDRDGKETTLDKVGWCRDTATQKPEPVGQLQPNAWGLYDMIGNVWEWVADWYAHYPDEPRTNPWGPLSDRGGGRVLRGGSAWDGSTSARPAFRGRWHPSSGDKNQGFRVTLPAVSEAIAPPETEDAYTSLSADLVDHPEAGTTRPSEVATLSALVRSRPGIPRTTAELTKAGLSAYLEKEVAHLSQAERSVAVLTVVERALPIDPKDRETLGIIAWALDYFPGRSGHAAEREAAVALRELAFGPLRKRCPPPPMPGCDDSAWAAIPGGSFLMGRPSGKEREDQRRIHEVTISPFRLAVCPVTAAEYARFVTKREGSSGLPATEVNWYSAYAYAAWVGGRLPTEAEWEFAARGGTPYDYSDHNGQPTTLDEVGWLGGKAKNRVQPVGQLKPNTWGLYDMIGNVYEWVADWYGYYSTNPQVDPWGPPSGDRRVIRGGSVWFDMVGASAGYRNSRNPDLALGDRGFRVALPAVPVPLEGGS